MKTIITNAGITAAIQAGISGPQIKISSVKIGNNILIPNVEMTDVSGLVWSGDSSYLQYQIVDDRTFLFKITLDESIGNFNIGNIGLFLDNGTLFCLTALTQVEQKIKNDDDSNVVGNRKIFEIPIVLSGISSLLDVTVMVPDEASIPFVQNELSLPQSALAPYTAYELLYHTSFKTPCLSLRTPNGWVYLRPSADDENLSFAPEKFADNALPGSLVYYNPETTKFELADGLDLGKGYVGIRGSLNNIIYNGTYRNPNWNLVSGTQYFADGGISSGGLTSTANSFYVGLAITNDILLMSSLNESIVNKTDIINNTEPSKYKYPSEYAVVNNLNSGFAKVDMSNVEDATFSGKITFQQIIDGTAYRALWGDLAEYYSSDEDYKPGTIVQFGGEQEVTIAKSIANAVVSTSAGFYLNCKLSENSVALALEGRVPVLVKGKVNKFDYIKLSTKPGVGVRTNIFDEKVIARALEDKPGTEEGLILCATKFTLI